jgi:preprotein translocase subunit SecD
MVILAIFIFAAVIVFPIGSQAGGLLFDRPIKLGLDLNGGVRLVYQADLSKIPADQQKAAMEADIEVIKKRVDSLGATEPIIKELSGNRILVELPGIKDVEQARDTIGKTDLIEFGEQATDPNDPAIKWKDNAEKNIVGNWKPATGTYNGQTVALTSSFFNTNTYVTANPNTGATELAFEFNTEGSELFKQITTRLIQKPVGIFSGDEMLSDPIVQDVISSRGVINNISQDDARLLSNMLNAGRLEVPLSILTDENVDSTLGSQFVDLAFKAAIIGLALVMIFMIIYYRVPGVMAALALIFFALINLAIFKLIPVTMTLGGLAGFIASIGMAVDTNVLIFERMKEEMRAGRTVGASIEAGFKRAWTAIIDCNIVNFIACVIMYFLGSSSVVSSSLITGFALTLFIGVAVSMFTAITVTRTLLRLFVGSSIAQKTALFTTIGGK